MIYVIINADDCGNTPQVNEAIDKALAQGAISSTTIMANSKYLDQVHDMVEKYIDASFGIHLNLTEGESFTQPKIFFEKGILDDNACFVHGNSKRCFNPSDELKKAVLNEWDAQLTFLEKEGFALSHVDGHHHCHTWPGFEQVLVTLVKKHNMTKVRNRYCRPILGLRENAIYTAKRIVEPLANLFEVKKLILHTSDITYLRNYSKAIRQNHILTTTYFDAYENMIPLLKSGRVDNCIIELMCHPGLKNYASEFEAILNDEIGIKNNKNIQLISYKDLL